MLIVCVCVYVCVFTGLKRFSGPLHLKIQPKCGYTAMSSALLKNSKPGKLMKGEWSCTTPSSFDRAWEAYSMLKGGFV